MAEINPKAPVRFPLVVTPQNRHETSLAPVRFWRDARLLNGFIEKVKAQRGQAQGRIWVCKRPGIVEYLRLTFLPFLSLGGDGTAGGSDASTVIETSVDLLQRYNLFFPVDTSAGREMWGMWAEIVDGVPRMRIDRINLDTMSVIGTLSTDLPLYEIDSLPRASAPADDPVVTFWGLGATLTVDRTTFATSMTTETDLSQWFTGASSFPGNTSGSVWIPQTTPSGDPTGNVGNYTPGSTTPTQVRPVTNPTWTNGASSSGDVIWTLTPPGTLVKTDASWRSTTYVLPLDSSDPNLPPDAYGPMVVLGDSIWILGTHHLIEFSISREGVINSYPSVWGQPGTSSASISQAGMVYDSSRNALIYTGIVGTNATQGLIVGFSLDSRSALFSLATPNSNGTTPAVTVDPNTGQIVTGASTGTGSGVVVVTPLPSYVPTVHVLSVEMDNRPTMDYTCVITYT